MKKHLIGIGGSGMSALAVALDALGDEVTGADRTLDAPNIKFLESLGIKCFPDDGSGVDASVGEVVVSTAIEVDNPGLAAAARLGIPVVHRAAALSKALSGRKLVAVAGTCGKSTVCAMLGHILSEAGLDPFCVDGANVPGWKGAVLPGKGEYAVAEVDESDKSLVAFNAYATIVTNASADHYSKEEMDEVFDAFVSRCPGPVVDGRKTAGEADVSQIGRHNRANAFLALEMAKALGVADDKARAALMSFCGVERRLQRYGANVYDDYAHNPEKLRAMWKTVAGTHGGPVCAVWRPHGYSPLRKMMDALSEMFHDVMAAGDALVLLPVYDAGGTAQRTVSSADLAARVPGAVCVGSHDEAFSWISERKDRFSAFAVCGARDPHLPDLARRIAGIV